MNKVIPEDPGERAFPFSNIAVVIVLLVLILVLYGPGVRGKFIWDDRTYFIDNDILPNLNPWDFKEIFLKESNYWGELLPVRDFLYVVQYRLFGLNPLGYHIVSIGLYVMICLMVYFFLKRFYSDKDEDALFNLKGVHIPAFAAASIFASYPVHVECVAYISSQKDLLFSLFSLAAMYLFYHFLNSQTRKCVLLVLGVFFYYLALLSKLTAVGLLVIVPVLYLLSDRAKRPEAFKAVGVWALVNIPALLWLLRCIGISRKYFGSTVDIMTPQLWERLLRSLKILGAQTLLGIKPYPLSFSYPFDGSSIVDLNLICGIIAAVSLSFVMLYFRKHRVVILASSLYVVFLVPVLQLYGSLTNSAIFDRYLFLPALGISVLFEKSLRALPLAPERLRRVYVPAIVPVVMVFSVIVIAYVPTLRDDISSTKNTYELFPEWPSSAFNYVYSLIENGRLDEAGEMIVKEKTLSSPPWVRGFFIGWILLEKGMAPEAIAELKVSSYLATSGGYYPFPNIPLAKALIKSGRSSEAMWILQEVLKSPVYQPLEFYRAKELLEEISRQ